jgi:hypothetical protein
VPLFTVEFPITAEVEAANPQEALNRAVEAFQEIGTTSLGVKVSFCALTDEPSFTDENGDEVFL